MNDFALLREYALKGSETAFETLVRRHLGMVYSAALRQTGDAGVAEEVAQAAFILLARKASGLSESVVVPGWLYRTACFMARRAVENRSRRRAVEKEAVEMILQDSNDEVWSRMTPHLDAALSELGERDRNALVLRFLQQQSFSEVAGALGISEDAAKKRVARALEKVRGLLNRRGIAVALAAMTAGLAANSVESAPAGLVRLTIESALGEGPASGSATALLLREAARESFIARLEQVSALSIAAVVLISGLAWWRAQGTIGSKSSSKMTASAAPKPLAVLHLQAMSTAKLARTNTFILRAVAAESGVALDRGAVFATFKASRARSDNLPSKPDSGISFPIESSGVARILLPSGRFNGMQYWVTAPGRVPVCVRWKREEEPSLPSEYTVRLEHGTSIGGTIVDESGQPVAGATLSFPTGAAVSKPAWDSREFVAYNTPATTPKTDVEDRWMADFISYDVERVVNARNSADSPLRVDLRVKVSHPSFIEQTLLLRNLWAAGTTNTLVMQRGVLVSGSVLDASGGPISGAIIRLFGERRADLENRAPRWTVVGKTNQSGLDQMRASAQSDASGRFQLPRVLPGLYELRAVAGWFDRTNIEFVAAGAETNLLLTLPQSPLATNWPADSVFRARVTDEDGQPLKDAVVRLAPGQNGFTRDEHVWSFLTDEKGRFQWAHAPQRVGRFVIQGNPWDRDWETQTVDLAPDGTEPVIVLRERAKMELRLAVTDHDTGRPVPAFKVAARRFIGSNHAANRALTDLEFIGEGRDGKFALRLPRGEPLAPPSSVAARFGLTSCSNVVIRAAGYLDREITISQQTNDLDLPVALDRAALFSGRVLTPAGLPAAGAEVSLIPSLSQFKFVKSDRLGPAIQPGWSQARSDGEGAFQVEATGFSTILASTHESGWGAVSLESPGEKLIQLQPWSRIEGTVQVGGKNWAGVDVRASVIPESAQRPGVELLAQTDEEGRFEFPQLPSGRLQIAFIRRFDRGTTKESHPKVVNLAAGRSSTILIGGSGARITGRAVQPTEDRPAIWVDSEGALFEKNAGGVSSFPRVGYPFAFRRDGSFVIEDVPPGDYELEPMVSVLRGQRGQGEESLPGFPQTIRIPESYAAGGNFDLGTIEIHERSK